MFGAPSDDVMIFLLLGVVGEVGDLEDLGQLPVFALSCPMHADIVRHDDIMLTKQLEQFDRENRMGNGR